MSRARLGPDHDPSTGREKVEAPTDQMPQPPLHRVTHHGATDRLADHEAGPHRIPRGAVFGTVGRCGRKSMHDDERPSHANSLPHRGAEVVAGPKAVLGAEHDNRYGQAVRPTAWRDPCDGAR